nr:hypothetical protein [Prevotella sp.]
MATRHELIHIDFVANAGKANPVMESLRKSCEEARLSKESLDKALADARASNASAKVIADLEAKLKQQTKIWQALAKGEREYTKGIDTLSKGIKEFNDGTLDQMSAKFNKAVYNAAKLVQSAVDTGSKEWNQLQRLMDATDRNVTRAKEDIVTMMQSLKDGSSVSTVQLTRAKEVLEDLSRLAVANSEDWRGLKAQMNEVAKAVEQVAATERSLRGEVASEQDAMRLSNALTQESISLRHADGEAAMQAARKEREGVESVMKGISDKMVQRNKELEGVREEIELQEMLDDEIRKRDEKLAGARKSKQDAERRRDEADRIIKEYDEQKTKVGELKKEVDELTKERDKEVRAAEKAAKSAEQHAKAVGEQQEKVNGLDNEVKKLTQDIEDLSKQPVKPAVDTSGVDDAKKKINQEPIKPKVDDSEIKALEARLKAVQDAIAGKRQQIENESRKGSGIISQWEEALARVQGSKDGRLTAMGLGDDKKQMDDLLDVANRFYGIVKDIKGITEDKFIPSQAAEPIKQLAEYYKITEEEARKLVHTMERSDVVQKKFATLRYDEQIGFLAIQQNQGKDDQLIRIEAAQSYLEKARERAAGQTERINKLTGEQKSLEEDEAELKGKIAAASEKAAKAAEQQNEAAEKKVKLTNKEQQELERLTKDNQDLDSAIELLKKHRDELTASEDKGADAAKKGAEAAKEEAQAMKMTAEEAKAALEEMKKLSTFEYKGGKLQISNPEEAQNFLRNSVKQHGIISKDGSYMLQSGKPVNDVVDDFKKRYNIEGGKKETLDIIRQLITGTDNGLIKSGFENSGNFSFKIDNEKLAARTRTMQELLSISKGITEAVKEQTAAERAQEIMVKRLREAYQHENEELERRKKVYQQRLADADAIGGPIEINGKLTQRGLEEQRAEEYKQKYIEGEKGQQAVVDKAYAEYQAAKTGAIKAETAATDANTKAKKDNVSVDQQKKQIDEQIAALEQQKAGNTERLAKLQEKGAKAAGDRAKATKEETQAVKESADAEMTMEELLKRRAQLDGQLAEKKKQLEKAQEKLKKMTESETAAEKEQSDVTERLARKTAEYNEELAKAGPMKEASDKAKKDRSSANRAANRADETIRITEREAIPERKSEEEMTKMRQQAESLAKEVNDLTLAYDQNAQTITSLNKRETEAAIEMAQSENVSIEKVKQAIELLKKKIETEATDAKTMQERGDAINRLSERLTQMNAEVAKLSQPIADRLKVDDLGKLSETDIRQGIEAAKQLIQTYESGSNEANKLAESIVRAEKHLKETGIEAARTAQKQAEAQQLLADKHKQMQERMQALNRLSKEGLTETQRYWQAQMEGATRGSRAFKEAERNLRRISAEQDRQTQAQLETSAGRLGRKNLRTLSGEELQESVNAAKQLLATMRPTNAAYADLQNNIIRAEEHMKQYGLETARSAQQAADRLQTMKDRMDGLNRLSDAGLEETRRYWQAQMDGAERTSQAYIEAKTNMETIAREQKRIATEQVKADAQRIYFNKMLMSEGSIRNAIEAAKQYQQTLAATSPEYQRLKTAIVDAEEHIRKYGVEAERAARKETEAARKRQELDTIMRKRLYNMKELSESDLRAQEQYWQRLVDDPKTASASLARYEKDLKRVHQLQEQMAAGKIRTEGQEAFGFFESGQDENASANETKRQADALKRYRDSLPQKDEADTIARINEYLAKAGQSAEKASKDVMSLADALRLAEGAGKDGFLASPQQIQQATKAIEQEREAVIRLIQQKKGSGQASDAEEKKLAELSKKLRDLKFEQDNFNMSQSKMQMLMKQPANAVSLEELRAAIKRADGELRRMEGSLDKNSKQYRAFAEQVKNAKNTLKEMEGQARATSSSWDKAWSRLKTYVGMYMGFNMLWSKMTATADDLLTLSDKMGEVRKTTGFTADEVGRLSDNLAKLDTRTSIENLLSISARGGQLGLKTQQDIQGFTEAANQLMVALPEMGEESATELMKIAAATGDLKRNNDDVRETLERVGSTIIALRANSASAAPAITDFVKRVGAVGAQAGITIDQVAALGSTVDALGGRVEMSATALSRMIPAIRNNAFAVANAIGITEKELKGMSGMEQMVTIFRKLHDSVKGFDMSTEEGMNGAADAVENMLGRSTSMQDVMKQLNQQGARAGIVFGLLSQNVDELERQLNTAGIAYSKNIALSDEYNNMNETAAGKLERLKNRIEEFFVSASAESWLGDIIGMLHKLVDLISDEGPMGSFFRYTIAYLTLMKMKWTEAIGTALISMGQFLFATQKSAAATAADTAAKAADAAATEAVAVANEEAAMATGKLNKAMKANLIAAVATAVLFLGMKLLEASKRAREAARQMDVMADIEKKAKEESVKERIELEKLYKATQDQTNSMEERKKALKDMVGDAKYNEYYSKLSTESELAAAAAGAYRDLSEQILATARARALDAKAEELQKKRIELEDEKAEREEWENENRKKYRAGKREYKRQQEYVGSATGGATAGFQESQIARQGATAMKPAIIDEFEGSVSERNRIKAEIGQIDKDLEKLKTQVSKLNIKSDTDNNGGGGGGGGSNPYGDYNKVTSPYAEWNGDDLVARRKEMLERVRALANGADVQAVLSEDAKFITDAVRKNIKTTDDAIEWYNSERLKIQDALHAKHLTNTGDWLDPKAQRKAGRVVRDEMKYYLDELDAYYTERKAMIQEAQNDEEISEAEARSRTIANEAEWRQRRAELQQLYARRGAEVAEAEQQAVFDIISERTGETTAFIQRDIAQTVRFIEDVGLRSKAAMDRILGDLDKGIEQDFLRQRNAIGQHMKAIRDIIDKERPFNGITRGLEDSLTTMGILTAHMSREREDLMAKNADMAEFNRRQAEESFKELTFLLGEAEHAYSSTAGEVMQRAAKAGLTAWVEEMKQNPQMQEGLMAQLRSTFDTIQDAIRKEASLLKKEAEIMWNNILMPGGQTTMKQAFDKTISTLGVEQGRVSRANSLIGAGQASERVADRLAIKQMQVQMAMQRAYYDLMRKRGLAQVEILRQQSEELRGQGNLEEAKRKSQDAQHVQMALNLATTKEQTELLKQEEELTAKVEESQNRLYAELREWSSLIASSTREMFEASNAGNREYYNELAKMNLTGHGGPGAGTYIVIDHEGTDDAAAHYEYLDQREALERQREIEQQNAQADAWKKVMDDINQRMSESITDWMNAAMQNQSMDLNTEATNLNTAAENGLTEAVNSLAMQMRQGTGEGTAEDAAGAGLGGASTGDSFSSDKQGSYPSGELSPEAQQRIDESNAVTEVVTGNEKRQAKETASNNQKIQASTQSTFAKMTQAANLYGIAYQAMSNDNLSASQKFEMIALQAVGNGAISALTTNLAQSEGETATKLPGILGKSVESLGPIAGPIVFSALTALLGGLMGMAVSKVAKSKSQIAQVTGASVGAGRMATGMMTYGEGNVNELTDPSTLTPGRQYNVDSADGKTYRARYMGKNAKTHITNGPEFHLVGEKGREAIIDAHTTRQLQMDDNGIWQSIQTLYNGGR